MFGGGGGGRHGFIGTLGVRIANLVANLSGNLAMRAVHLDQIGPRRRCNSKGTGILSQFGYSRDTLVGKRIPLAIDGKMFGVGEMDGMICKAEPST